MVPHNLHKTLAIQSFQAGLHVILEKPMAPSIQECEEIISEYKKSGKIFMVAENSQYWPEVVFAKKMITDGVIGDIISARAVYLESKQVGRYTLDNETQLDKMEWRSNASVSGGGITIDGGSHWIRPLRILLGEIDKVVAFTAKPLPSMEGESLVRALFKFPNGVIATFEATMADTVFSPDPYWRIIGTKGEIVIEDIGVKLFNKEHPSGKQVLSDSGGYFGSFAPEIEDFANAVNQGTKLAAPAEHSLGELRTALAIYKSVKEEKWVKVWD